jgi:chorismate mutase
MPVRALRGATTIEADTEADVRARVAALVQELFARNELATDDVVSVVVTATNDIHSFHPATAVRACGLSEVPILGAQEIDVTGSLARCIRMMLHIETERPRTDMVHVFLEGAVVLRPDLARS